MGELVGLNGIKFKNTCSSTQPVFEALGKSM
jgi:hypothetical protein